MQELEGLNPSESFDATQPLFGARDLGMPGTAAIRCGTARRRTRKEGFTIVGSCWYEIQATQVL